MKKNIYSSVFILLVSLCLFIPRLAADAKMPPLYSEPDISLDLQDANLKDVLKLFSIQANLNFIASENIQNRKITLYLDKVPLKQAMDKLFKANNLVYELDKGANIFIVKDLGTIKPEAETRIFFLKYASVASSALLTDRGSGSASTDTGITAAVKKLISGTGTVIEDNRTNSLIVTDTPINMPMIAKVISSLDIAVPQVMLEVEMLDVNKNLTENLGIKYGATPLTLSAAFKGSSWGSKFPFGSLFGDKSKSFTGGSVALNDGSDDAPLSTYQILLQFLKTQSDTRALARPKILSLNNETAEIKIVTQEAIGVSQSTASAGGSTGTTTSQAERVETGVSLKVTPQINPDTGEITMYIVPAVTDTGAAVTFVQGSLTSTFKNPECRTTKSAVRVKDGETIILGGLIRKDKKETITKLPILGDIPVLGAFFRHKEKTQDTDRELLVFITPHLIKDNSVKLAQARKTVLPEREQSAISGITRELEISAGLNNLEKKYK